MICLNLVRVNETMLILCVFESPSCIISLVSPIDIPAMCMRLHASDEVFASSADPAGLSLDLLCPSPVSCNTLLCDE